MRVLIAGASGAIGRPLIRCLGANRETVFALARTPESAGALAASGAEPMLADALDSAAVGAAVVRVRPEAVINELTAVPRHYTPADMAADMAAATERDRLVRIEGSRNLFAALPDAGVRRYLVQSSAFWYGPGEGLADEEAPFAIAASPAVAAGSRRYAESERAAAAVPGVACVALRYGFFYGPGTWFSGDGDVGEQVRRRRIPVIGDGGGVWSFVHVEDAAATAAALAGAPGAYNLVDGDPAPQHLWLPAFARTVGAPSPPRISDEEAAATLGPDAVYYATRLRGAANGKARRELGFRPRRLEWLDGKTG